MPDPALEKQAAVERIKDNAEDEAIGAGKSHGDIERYGLIGADPLEDPACGEEEICPDEIRGARGWDGMKRPNRKPESIDRNPAKHGAEGEAEKELG